jgi:hypothetical protein
MITRGRKKEHPMPKQKLKRKPNQSEKISHLAQPPDREANAPPTGVDPAAERGERIETGKMIHRGGKSSGHVPGAMEPKA